MSLFHGIRYFRNENDVPTLHVVSLNKIGMDLDAETFVDSSPDQDELAVYVRLRKLSRSTDGICFVTDNLRLQSLAEEMQLITCDKNEEWLDNAARLWFPNYKELPASEAYGLAVYSTLNSVMNGDTYDRQYRRTDSRCMETSQG